MNLYLLGGALLAGALAVGGATWWHVSKVDAAHEAGVAEANKACETAKLKARGDALEEAIELDRITDVLDNAREQQRDADIKAIAGAARQALATYRESVNALRTADNRCRVPADRVRDINRALGHGAAAPEG